MSHFQPARFNPIAAAVFYEGGIGLLGLLLIWWLGVAGDRLIQLTWTAIGHGAVATLPLLVILVAMTRWPIGPLGPMKRFLLDQIMPLFDGCGWFDFAMIAALAGVGEELLFRGALQFWLGEQLSPTTGLLVASGLFGLAHPLSVSYAVLAGVYGLYFGVLWLATGNLLVPMVAHACYDFAALVYLNRQRRAGSP